MTKGQTIVVFALIFSLPAFVWSGVQAERSARQQRLNGQLLRAVRLNDAFTAARFLDAGADPNARRTRGMPPARLVSLALARPELRPMLLDSLTRRPRLAPDMLWYARMAHRTDLAALLLKHGANPDNPTDGVPPLLDIVAQGDTPMLKIFLDAGANVNQRNQAGKTALTLARENKRMEIVKLLQAAGGSE